MAKTRKNLISSLQITFLSFFLISCSLPKIIVYDDPLTAKEHNDLGVIYEKKGKLDLAEREYKKAIKKDRAWYLPYFNLGNLYYKRGEKDRAIKFYKKALEKEENPDILNNLAFVLYETEEYKEALVYIEKAIKMDRKEEYTDTYNKIVDKLKSPLNQGGR